MVPNSPEGFDISKPRAGHDQFLDWLRGIAAVLVFVAHVRGAFFVQWSDLVPASQTAINQILFFLTRLGREAVVIFFVLSGYLVGGQAVADFRQQRWSLGRYLIARVARMYVVVVPALVLTGVFDFWRGSWQSARDGLQPFLANLFFLQGIVGGAYGSNGPLWSLAYEWWFYILFGFALSSQSTNASLKMIANALIVAATAAMLWLACPDMLWMFPLWLLGVMVRLLPRVRSAGCVPLTGILLLLFVCLAASSVVRDWRGDWLVALATAACIHVSRGAAQPSGAWYGSGSRLAAFSFSLYALHYPLNNLLLGALLPQRRTAAGPIDWLIWVALIIAEASICYGFFWLFERKTPAIKKWLLRLLPSSPPGERRSDGKLALSAAHASGNRDQPDP
jgi:peptidoglycan/LPS O-acetylase OafA/YrhL